MILFKQLPQRSPDGTVLQAYQWDAKNRLVKILEGMQETEFAYDGKDRRVLKIERTHGSEISRTHYIWEGSNIVQSRAADASTLQRNYFQQGSTLRRFIPKWPSERLVKSTPERTQAHNQRKLEKS